MPFNSGTAQELLNEYETLYNQWEPAKKLRHYSKIKEALDEASSEELLTLLGPQSTIDVDGKFLVFSYVFNKTYGELGKDMKRFVDAIPSSDFVKFFGSRFCSTKDKESMFSLLCDNAPQYSEKIRACVDKESFTNFIEYINKHNKSAKSILGAMTSDQQINFCKFAATQSLKNFRCIITAAKAAFDAPKQIVELLAACKNPDTKAIVSEALVNSNNENDVINELTRQFESTTTSINNKVFIDLLETLTNKTNLEMAVGAAVEQFVEKKISKTDFLSFYLIPVYRKMKPNAKDVPYKLFESFANRLEKLQTSNNPKEYISIIKGIVSFFNVIHQSYLAWKAKSARKAVLTEMRRGM